MNNIMYAIIAIIIIAIIAAAAIVLTGSKGAPATGGTSAASTYYTSNTTAPTTAAGHGGNGTTGGPGYSNSPGTCTPTNSTFTCSNVTFSATSHTTVGYATIGQKTGQEWSGFGVGFAPNGTKYLGGIPQIAFYSYPNYTNPTGGNLSSGSEVHMVIYQGSNVSGTAAGTIWACYINSGILYVGTAGCSTQSGTTAQYVRIGKVG